MFPSTLHSPKPPVRSTFVLASGLSIKWARFVSWVVTTPVLLGQIGGISQVKWGNFNMNSAMTAADLVMITAGLTAQVAVYVRVLVCLSSVCLSV